MPPQDQILAQLLRLTDDVAGMRADVRSLHEKQDQTAAELGVIHAELGTLRGQVATKFSLGDVGRALDSGRSRVLSVTALFGGGYTAYLFFHQALHLLP